MTLPVTIPTVSLMAAVGSSVAAGADASVAAGVVAGSCATGWLEGVKVSERR